VTVNAVDAGWNLVNTVTDKVSIVSSELNATLPANAALVAGTRSFSVMLNMAGSWTVTATDVTDGGKTPGTSSLVTVKAPVAEEFFLPMPEQQILTAFTTINSGATTPITAVFSIVVTMSGTVVTYDQWENGYEADLNNPTNLWSGANLGGTQIWGDGDDSNGICPGFAHDPTGLVAGTVIALRNDVVLPRVSSSIFYDGGDRVGATAGHHRVPGRLGRHPGTRAGQRGCRPQHLGP